jgi:hypothetical protein
MNARVFPFIEAGERVDYRRGLLCGGRIVKVNEGFSVNRPGKNGEIGLYSLGIVRGMRIVAFG